MNKDVRSPFASRWERKEAKSSRWSCAGDSVWPPLASGWVWPVRSSSLTSWPDCSTACRLPICPPSLASPLYLPLSRSPPAISRRCASCASIQSLHSTPNDFLALLETCLRSCGHPNDSEKVQNRLCSPKLSLGKSSGRTFSLDHLGQPQSLSVDALRENNEQIVWSSRI